MTIDTRSARAGYREWAGLGVLALPCLPVSMDANVLNLAIPQLATELEPTGAQLLWVVDSYVFVVAGLLLTMGMLGDRVGRRRLLLVGAATFGAASLLAAFSGTVELLILARVLLGVAGATLMPSTLALIRSMFHDRRERRIALGVWTASFAVGGLVGPVVGGLLLSRFWWGSVFLVAVPVMVMLLVLGPFLLPEYRNEQRPRIDGVSAALSLGAVLSIVYGVKRAAEHGLRTTDVAVVLAGTLLAVWFVRRQRRPDPMLDLGLFRNAAFSTPLVINSLAFFVLYGTQFVTAQYLQLVLGLSPLEAGLATVPGTVAYLVGSVLAPLIVNRFSTAYAMAGSLVVTAAGFGLLTQVGANGLRLVIAGSIVFSLGLAPVYVLSTDLTVSAAPPNQFGATSAIVETGAELGGALGIACLGSTVVAVYRRTMPADPPPDVPVETLAEARRTLGGAAAAADRLGGSAGTDLLESARTAFLQGFRLAEVVGTAVMVGAAVAAPALLRRTRSARQPR